MTNEKFVELSRLTLKLLWMIAKPILIIYAFLFVVVIGGMFKFLVSSMKGR